MDTNHKADETRDPRREEHHDPQPEKLHGEAMAEKMSEQRAVKTDLRDNAAVKDKGAASIKRILPQAQGQRQPDRGGRK